jgi:RNA recognition motif-containing protein
VRKGGVGTGFAFVRFEAIEGAISAFAALDKTYYQGRKLHILPAQKKPPQVEKPQVDFRKDYDDPYADEEKDDGKTGQKPSKDTKESKTTTESKELKKSNFKKEKEADLKENFDDEVNWNYLFMN